MFYFLLAKEITVEEVSAPKLASRSVNSNKDSSIITFPTVNVASTMVNPASESRHEVSQTTRFLN